MAEFEDRLRQTLRRRAAGVPLVTDVPSGLVRRAELRIARNVSAAALSVTLLAVGVLTGVQALKSPSVERPAATAPACRSTDLSGVSKLDTVGKLGEVKVGRLILTNHGAPCSLSGKPTVRVLHKGEPEQLTYGALQPLWQETQPSPPPGWPVVTLRPGGQAIVHVKWTNWCDGSEQPGDPDTWEIQLPGGRGSVHFPAPRHDVPICGDGTTASKLRTGPFEPYST